MKHKKKRSLPPVLKAWQVCRMRSGVKPGKKMTPKEKREARACVEQYMGRGK